MGEVATETAAATTMTAAAEQGSGPEAAARISQSLGCGLKLEDAARHLMLHLDIGPARGAQLGVVAAHLSFRAPNNQELCRGQWANDLLMHNVLIQRDVSCSVWPA